MELALRWFIWLLLSRGIVAESFIAIDLGGYYQQYLYSYGGNLYQYITKLNGFLPTTMQMWKSVDNGSTWAVLASTLSIPRSSSSSVSPLLIGTKLYFWGYIGPVIINTTLYYFDFTTETFNIISTTSSPTSRPSSFISGLTNALIYTIAAGGSGLGSLIFGKYVLNVFSSISTLNPIAPYTYAQPQSSIQGTSGIVHVLYEATKQSTAIGPADLGYVNINGGSVTGSIGSQIIYPNYADSILIPDTGGGLGQIIQIGTNIYCSFYDPFNQQIKLISFDDSATPTFNISIIDPVWPIVTGPPNDEPGTGSYSNILGYYGGILYCFYVNTWSNSLGFHGDSTLYYRSSSDNGVTWSGRSSIIIHLDPSEGTSYRIWYPQSVVYVDAQPSPIVKIGLSYAQSEQDLSSQYLQGRFFTNLILSPVTARWRVSES